MKKIGLNEAKNRLIEKHGENILMEEYVNMRSSANFKCLICGNNWSTKAFSVLIGGNGCNICSHKKSEINLEIAKNRLYEIHGSDIDLLKYTNISEKALFLCNICDNKWDVVAYSIINQGQGCKICAYRKNGLNRSGENSNFWKGGITKLKSVIFHKLKWWRKLSSKNCNHRCIITGDDNFDIHHLYPLNNIIQDALIELNFDNDSFWGNYSGEEMEELMTKISEIHYRFPLGVCIEKNIHKLFHKIYSNNCTPEDFYEFQDKINSGEIQIDY